MLFGFQVPTCVAQTKKALSEGMCVVIGLQSTGEANVSQARDSDGASEVMDDLVSAPKMVLQRFITEWLFHWKSPNTWDIDALRQLQALVSYSKAGSPQACPYFDITASMYLLCYCYKHVFVMIYHKNCYEVMKKSPQACMYPPSNKSTKFQLLGGKDTSVADMHMSHKPGSHACSLELYAPHKPQTTVADTMGGGLIPLLNSM